MKITEILQAEHAVFHNLFDHIEKVVPRLATLVEIRGMARLLESMLQAHAQVEDELVILPLEHCLEHLGQRENFHQEHHEMDDNLKRVSTAKSVTDARKRLLAAVLFSRHHFDREERIVFPLAEKMLKAATLASLGKAYLERRQETVAD